MSDLTADEQAKARLALRFLETRFGGIGALSKALRFKATSVRRVTDGHDPVSARLVLRIARLAGVGFDDVVAGKYPVEGACPHCGHVP